MRNYKAVFRGTQADGKKVSWSSQGTSQGAAILAGEQIATDKEYSDAELQNVRQIFNDLHLDTSAANAIRQGGTVKIF